jgi:beta-lactamase class A
MRRLIIAGALAVLVAVLALGGAARVAAVDRSATALEARWARQEASGVPAARFKPLGRELESVLRASLPARLSGSVGAPQIEGLERRTRSVWVSTWKRDRTAARAAWMRLRAVVDGRARVPWQKAATPLGWLNLSRSWSSTRRTWQHALQRLGPDKNGLPVALDALWIHVRSLHEEAHRDHAPTGGAAHVLADVKAFRRAAPPVELHEYPALLRALRAANQELQEDITQALAAAGGIPPGLASKILGYLATRQGVEAVAVDDLQTGQAMTIHPTARFDTASIVKAAIMATLLWQSQTSHQPLTAETRSLMTPMIETSDNADATALWDQAGGPAAIAAFVHRVGMSNTTPNVAWGLTTTTAPDQLKLLAQLALPGSLLTPANQAYALGLMEHVTSWEAWGVTGGVPAGVTVALKNGWLPLANGEWEINSIGYVNGDGKAYTIAVLTQGNPTMPYGVETIDTVSAMVWQAISPTNSAAAR